MSISKFEKALTELKGRSELRGRVYLESTLLSKHVDYVSAKKEMMDEQNLFRSTSITAPLSVEVPLTTEDLFRATHTQSWASTEDTVGDRVTSQGKDEQASLE